ncbi:4-diphosphocytidyl-2-C-methyl-D-erythritol kinase [Gordonia araii NBRC 100433]|uniref:4-diphosphocytidyl-2-C-methyl-D-erythritol kinase n=1 Tax=Gordonia araii NBRC 100433 TaxID=1073574 RepID=G7H637_9ACTN|nr:4-(cytidine 5'-diphospho)-2-C-methyl-D-erythritol kinase [Gordonia araii]NNG98725.1 4-(cytidine 5'-diphospho)-2-C-methyl-D-erythritol kinase [Gordonia araii NBRC 100433]GAB11276.1 4-diphosphocytidyl-2-C-methyl-D-erythritol kinase [Gordonia araii NBRC 100433]
MTSQPRAHPGAITARAAAKINLYLGVGEARADGYHDLTTVFQAVSLFDDVTVSPSTELSVRTSGEGAADVPDDPAQNLAARAARRVDPDARVAIEIDKSIPVAGGMAGGSADAAAALVACTRLLRVDWDRAELMAAAAELGSDVPFSVHGGTALGVGRGERLSPVLSRGEYHWVIAVAKSGLSTPTVFAELDRLRAKADLDDPAVGEPEELLRALASGDVERVAGLLHNDLQPAALSLQPVLRRTLRAGADAGALAGIVSGSGPTCVFLCSDGDSAVRVAAELAGRGVAKSVRTAHGPVSGAHVL